MSTFYAKDQLFWLDDQPLLVQAGEFHYFRTPADQWEHRLNLLLKAGFNAVAAYIPWLWHQPEPDISDVDGHTHPMRDLAGFLDLAARMGLYIIARPGPYIMAETINEGIPPWVFSQNPQAAFIGQDGTRQNVASYMHPDFLRCVDDWYKAVFEVISPRQVTQGGNILMVQLDNEMGMIQWVRNLIDLNPDTITRFADHVRAKYGDKLLQRYDAPDLTAFLRVQIATPQPPHAVSVIEDYRDFYRAYLRDYMLFLWKCAQKYGMDTPPVVNIHGFGNGGKTFPIGLSQLVDAMAIDGMISATDVYPLHIDEGNIHHLLLVNEMTKALQNKDQALFSIEFQSGGNQDFSGAQSSLYDLHTRLCVSCGMRAINHYLFFDGENDPVLSPVKRHNWGHPVRKDGTLRRGFDRYPKLSRVLAAYGEALVRSRPSTVTTIGFLIDTFMTEVNNPFTKSGTDILTHQRDTILFDLIARGLALTHRPYDAVELTRADLIPVDTPTLWMMMEKQCDVAVQQKLLDYIRGGGRLILIGRLCEQTFDHTPCTILKDGLGIQAISSDPPFMPVQNIRIFDDPEIPVGFMERYSGDFDEVFAMTADEQTVGFVKQVGAGQVMVLGAALAANTPEDLAVLDQMAARMGIDPLLDLSEWADVRVSEGETGNFLFISNYQDDPIETFLSFQGKSLFGEHAVSLPARQGAILPLKWEVKPGVVIHYLTSEVTEVVEEGTRLILKTAQPEFFAGLSISGYRVQDMQETDSGRVTVHETNGVIELERTVPV